MNVEEQALLRRYGQRKYHEAFQLRKSEREAEMQRLYVLDAIYQKAQDELNEPFYAQAIAEQRHYENMERVSKAFRQFNASVRKNLLPVFERATKSLIEMNRVLEDSKSK